MKAALQGRVKCLKLLLNAGNKDDHDMSPPLPLSPIFFNKIYCNICYIKKNYLF